jgi:uncharacterized protein YndB with AHSA1/START domain
MSDTDISDEAVEEATGKVWKEWFSLLDDWGADEKGHKATAEHLTKEHDLPGWWSQMVTVAYERERGLRKVGESEDGFQVGVQRTFMPDPSAAWQLVTGPEGLAAWLGPGAPDRLVEGATYELDNGTRGEVRVVEPGSHLRLTWQPTDWPAASTVQVRVSESDAGRGTIVFHHEQIPTEELREAMRVHWTDVLAGLREAA